MDNQHVLQKGGDWPHFDALPINQQAAIMGAVNSLCEGNPGAVVQLQKLAELRIQKPSQWSLGLKILKIGQ